MKGEKRQGKDGRYSYYRLFESYRDSLGFTQRRSVLGLGRMEVFTNTDRMNFILLLNKKLRGIKDIFPNYYGEKVNTYTEDIFTQLVAMHKVDLPGMDYKADSGKDTYIKEREKRFIVKASSLVHQDVREIGAEHLCIETIKRLKIDKALLRLGFTPDAVRLAVMQIAARAVHPASELATAKWLRERSELGLLAVCDTEKLTKDHLYASVNKLYRIKDDLKTHLSRWTKELFSYDDSIILYDLTNTYFEGQMKSSQMCAFGRSKEKRSDCKLIVLALVVNQLGFPKHYQLFEGNMSDSKSLGLIIDELDSHLKELDVKPVIVMDAGIATDDNLLMLRKKEYRYLCVSRSSQKDYSPKENAEKTIVRDNLGQPIELQRVEVKANNSGDHYLWVKSHAKAAKEEAMTGQFTKRFEAELSKIKESLSKKHGTKQIDRVNERIGRARGKYPSVSSHYDVQLSKSPDKETVLDMSWSLKARYEEKDNCGVYFLRTNMEEKNQKTVWFIYNILKEVESSFRCMKTDLDLRPVYHKTDHGCLAHLHLGILAYWVVVTIRHQLKAKGIHHNWKQIVEIMNTHKSVRSTMKNMQEETVYIQKCSLAGSQVCEIYKAAQITELPYKMIKSVGTQIEKLKNNTNDSQEFNSG